MGTTETTKFLYILKQEKEVIIMEQRRYVEGVKMLRRDNYMWNRKLEAKEETLYKQIVGQLNWTVQHTRPDLAFGVSGASQIGREKNTRDFRRLLKMVGREKENHLEVRLREEVEIETYTDASFSNIKEGRSQVGFEVGIRDEGIRKFSIYWKFRRGKRVARSSLEAEAISLNEGLEMAL